MRSMYFLGFVVVGAVVATAAGCGDDVSGSGGAGAAAASSSSTTTTGATTTSGTGGSTGDGNDTFETATEFAYGTEDDTVSLDPADVDVDFYKFDGIKGQQVLIQANAKPDADPFNTGYLDTVVTLYSQDQTQIAQNDDPTPRFSNNAQLFTVLPADGTYYVRVAECNYVFPGLCAPVADITDVSYAIYIGDINPAILLNEMAGVNNPIDYGAMDPMTGYPLRLLSGGFSADTETDTYTFTVPADVVVDPANRAVSLFSFFPSGSDGSGSTTDIQSATITDVASGTVIAQVNPALGGDLFAPLTLGTDYQLDIAHTTGAAGINPFYYSWHIVDATSNPIEDPAGTNDQLVDAEAMVADDQGNGSVVYRIDADIVPAGDVDYFSFAIPVGVDQLSVFCDGQRSGSGVRDLAVSVVDGNGTPLQNGTMTETEDTPLEITQLPIPAGATTLALRISAGTQDATVTGTYYRCGLVVYPMP